MQDTITYDPEIDNCANMPECGDARVLFTWYCEPAACCPRCYRNLFGADAEPWRVVNIAAAPDRDWPSVHLRLEDRAIPA